jgi:cell wall-associated NlpC family hydrolase
MKIIERTWRQALAALIVAAAVGGGGASSATAEEIQPATTGCVIQGEGTPCTWEESPGSSESTAEQSAVGWAQAQMGSTQWDGYCLEFVYQAYLQAGVDITAQAGASDTALDFWNSYGGTKYPPSDNPRAGALVFWDATPSNSAGHVAISEGNGMAVSVEERSYTGVHEMTIAYRNQQGYTELGWVMPG